MDKLSQRELTQLEAAFKFEASNTSSAYGKLLYHEKVNSFETTYLQNSWIQVACSKPLYYILILWTQAVFWRKKEKEEEKNAVMPISIA